MTSNPVAAGLRQSGNLFAFFIDVVKAVPRRPQRPRQRDAWVRLGRHQSAFCGTTC